MQHIKVIQVCLKIEYMTKKNHYRVKAIHIWPGRICLHCWGWGWKDGRVLQTFLERYCHHEGLTMGPQTDRPSSACGPPGMLAVPWLSTKRSLQLVKGYIRCDLEVLRCLKEPWQAAVTACGGCGEAEPVGTHTSFQAIYCKWNHECYICAKKKKKSETNYITIPFKGMHLTLTVPPERM